MCMYEVLKAVPFQRVFTKRTVVSFIVQTSYRDKTMFTLFLTETFIITDKSRYHALCFQKTYSVLVYYEKQVYDVIIV